MGFGKEEMSTNWENDWSDNKLIYGGPKEGKTTVAAQMLKDNLDGDPEAMAYVVNTDKGFAKPARFVGLGDPKYKDRIVYYFVNGIQRAIDVMNEIRETVESRGNCNDTILFDLLSWSWDESQKEFVSELSNGEVVGYISKAMKDPAKFGAFEGMQWGYIKKVEDMVSNYLTKNPICKVIALARVKDVTITYKLGGLKKDLWYHIGKPDSRKDIMHEFAIVIKIEKYKEDGVIKRKFMTVASRDGDPDYKWYAYDTPENFCEQIRKMDGGMPIKAKALKDDIPTEEEIFKNLRLCIKETFSDSEFFSAEDVIGTCGHPELVMSILEQAVKAEKLFYDEGSEAYSFSPFKESEKDEPEAVVPIKPVPEKDIKIAEPTLEVLENIIYKCYNEDHASIENIMSGCMKHGLYSTEQEVEKALSMLFERGTAMEIEYGKIGLLNIDSVSERNKESQSENDDEGWM